MYGFSIFAVLLFGYQLLSYVVLPAPWGHYKHHPKLQNTPKTTQTVQNIQRNPLNVALVGTKVELVQTLLTIGWYPTDPITFQISIAIAESVLLNRPYLCAPVSNLYLWERKQDLVFELPVKESTRQRHHVRFWQSDVLGNDGRTLWIEAATFDCSVGFNHFISQITHPIAPDIDTECEQLLLALKQAGQITQIYQVTGVGVTLQGRNGGEDWYYTDGELTVVRLFIAGAVQAIPPSDLTNPTPVKFGNQLWSSLHCFLAYLET